MVIHNTITIIKTKSLKWQVQFATIVIGEFTELDEARTFAMSFKQGNQVVVWDNGEQIEQFNK